MIHKVAVTCPPMLQSIDAIRAEALRLSIELTTPTVVQTLAEDELIKLLEGHDGWIIGDDPANERVVKAAKRNGLKAAVKWGVGIDNVDFLAFEQAGIPVANTPNMFGDEVADLAVCYLVGLARHAFYIDRKVREGEWPKPSGSSLRGKVVGVVGLGDIGLQVARRLQVAGVRVEGWDPKAKEIPEFVSVNREWPRGVGNCDFLVFCCALNSSTYRMFNKELLESIKPGLRVVNVSRGALICEDALLEGLSSGVIESAALDVFENEPLEPLHGIRFYDRCILGSHNASNTFEAVDRTSRLALQKLAEMLAKR